MISKEQIPAPHASEPDPAELPDALKQALQNAYPNPDGRIAAKVMEQIRLEKQQPASLQPTPRKAQETAHHRAEKAERRRHRHGIIMKYGGMAACMVILSGALVIASPLMGRTADNAAMDAAFGEAETHPETAICAVYDDAVPEVQTYATADNGNAMLYTADMTDADVPVEEEMEAEENALRTASAPAEKAPEVEECANFTVKMRSSRPETAAGTAPADAALSEDAIFDAACSDDAGTQTADAFARYLIENGFLTEAEFRQWIESRTAEAPWTPEELCSAFGLEISLYSSWAEER
ncbi:MAG: hypothetical protein II979_00260 [Clostridia bacterium]|nr:hypothetical protein [Clostridia bacterium]